MGTWAIGGQGSAGLVVGWTRTLRAFPASVTLWLYGQMDDKSMREKGGNSLFSGSETETDQT